MSEYKEYYKKGQLNYMLDDSVIFMKLQQQLNKITQKIK